MVEAIFGLKTNSTRRFTQDGTQIPLTGIMVRPMTVVQIKTQAKDGYNAIQVGVGEKRPDLVKKPILGHLKNLKNSKPPLYLREIKINNPTDFKLGQVISPAQVITAGDLVNISSISKGKGFAGVVKRWHFAGGPRTHGQSDRERSPGSIGQTTTPGRVYKGKKMAGRLGGQTVTIRNLLVLSLDEEKNLLWLKGLIPGYHGCLVSVKKVGHRQSFKPLLKSGEAILVGGQEAVSAKDETKKETKVQPEPSADTNLANQEAKASAVN